VVVTSEEVSLWAPPFLSAVRVVRAPSLFEFYSYDAFIRCLFCLLRCHFFAYCVTSSDDAPHSASICLNSIFIMLYIRRQGRSPERAGRE
jgi:hypothetical protein